MDESASTDPTTDRGPELSASNAFVDRVESLCRDLTDEPAIEGAGLLLMDADGGLRTVATDGAAARALATAEVTTGGGPCHETLLHGPAGLGPTDLAPWPTLAGLLASGPPSSVSTAPIVHVDVPVGALFVVHHPRAPREADVRGVAVTAAERIGRALDAGLARLSREFDAGADAPSEGPDAVLRQLAVGLGNRRQLDEAVVLIAHQTGSSSIRSGRRLRQLADALEVPAITIARRILEQGRLPHPHEFLADASERSHREELARLALTDPLTGLANRVLLLDRLEHAVWRSRRGTDRPAVLYIDLDGFKLVNDTLGHNVGDHVLRTAAARIQTSVRPQDTVGRLGGDEFAVVCEGVDGPPTAVAIADRIAQALREPVPLDELSHRRAGELPPSPSVGASIGIAVAEPSQSAEAVLRAADTAMYRSKLSSTCITVFVGDHGDEGDSGGGDDGHGHRDEDGAQHGAGGSETSASG